MLDGLALDELRDAALEAGALGQCVEHRAGVGVLGLAPGLDGGVVPVFEPAVVFGYFDAVVDVGDRALLGGRGLAGGGGLQGGDRDAQQGVDHS